MRRSSALSRARQWWPEMLSAAFLGLFLLVRAQDGPLFVVFVAIVLAIGWGMGHRHRALPLHRKIDGLTDGFRELAADIRDERAAEDDGGRPNLRLVD